MASLSWYLRQAVNCPLTCKVLQLAPLRIFVAGLRVASGIVLRIPVGTSAPVSILNSTGLLFTHSAMDQGSEHSDCSTVPMKAASSPADSTVLTVPGVRHIFLKWPFLPHPWHFTSLAGHCCLPWVGVFPHLGHFLDFPLGSKGFVFFHVI